MEFRGPIGMQLVDAFAAGIYLFFGIVHLDLWRKRRDRPGHVWLAAASFGALTVDLTGMALRGRDVGAGVIPMLNLLGVVVVTVSLLALVLALGNRSAGPLTKGASLIAALFALLGGLGGIVTLIPFFFIISLGLLLLALALALRDARKGDPESRAIAGGLVILLGTLILDVLRLLELIEAAPGLPIIGFAAMFLISASSLNSRYEREHRELLSLRDDLERRVTERTHELEEANVRLAEAVRTDALTALPNRRGFLDVADHELKRSARAGEPLSLVMVDLDHFKLVNDRHGHAAGDSVLQAAASLLRGVVRKQDLVARWGGEEFIVLLPNTSREAAESVAEKARLKMAAASFDALEGEGLTASFGVALHQNGRLLEATIAAADRALYLAKETGRNRVKVSA